MSRCNYVGPRSRGVRGAKEIQVQGGYQEVEAILSELEIEARKNVIKTALIFVYANHVEAVTRNRAFYNLVGAILEKYSPRSGLKALRNSY